MYKTQYGETLTRELAVLSLKSSSFMTSSEVRIPLPEKSIDLKRSAGTVSRKLKQDNVSILTGKACL